MTDSNSFQTDGSSTRRALLGAGATALTVGLTGCNSDSDTGTTQSGPTPSLSIKNARVVQNVENTEIEDASDTIPDPPIVAEEYATIMFDLDVTHPENLPETVPVAVTAGVPEISHSMQLHRSDIESINDGGDPAAVFHDSVHVFNNTGDGPPVFKIPQRVNEITIQPVHSDVDTNTVVLTEGANADFEVVDLPTLRVAFVEMKDPGSTPPRYHGHGNTVHEHTTDISWGDANGEAAFYDRSVNSSIEYLRRAYPGTVVAYKHEKPAVGLVREDINNAATRDAERARRSLNNISSTASFPTNGTIIEGNLDRQKALDLMDVTKGGGFDAHVMICPRGTASGNQTYFDAHWRSGSFIGYHWHYNAAVGSEETGNVADDVIHVGTTAQEVAHRFSGNPYKNGKNKPFARKGDFDGDGQSEDDPGHANDALVSTGYDLTDGTYSLINDWSVDNGTFSNSRAEYESSEPVVTKHVSHMSYAGGDTWADSRIHRLLIDGSYTKAYTGGGSGGSPARNTGSGSDGATPPVIELFGTVVDDRIEFHDAATYRAAPGGNEYDETANPEATPVEVTLEGPDGEALSSTVVADRFHGSHPGPEQGPHRSVAASLPFPDRGVSIRTNRDGVESRLNPIVAPLRYRLHDVSADAFVEGEATITRLREILQDSDSQMAEHQYAAAATTLREEFVPGVESGIESYEAYADQPTPGELVSLARSQIQRLESFGDSNPSTPTEPEPCPVPSGDRDGSFCDQLQANIEAGLVPYDAAGEPTLFTLAYPCGWGNQSGMFELGDHPQEDYQEVIAQFDVIASIDGSDRFVYMLVRQQVPPAPPDELEKAAYDNYETLTYEFGEETRTAKVSIPDFGTVAHTLVPYEHDDGSTTQHLVSIDATPKPGGDCSYGVSQDLVKRVVRSFEPNPDTTFSQE
jgi:hypothetical protein